MNAAFASTVTKAMRLRNLVRAADELDNDAGTVNQNDRDRYLRELVTSLLNVAGDMADELVNEIEALEMDQRHEDKRG